MPAFDALTTRVLNAITDKGQDVTFPGTGTPVYDPATDTWSGSGGSDVKGKAVQTRSDPDKLKAANLVLLNPVTLMVAGSGLGIVPEPGMSFSWSGKTYTARLVDPHGPDGTPIYYTVTGEA